MYPVGYKYLIPQKDPKDLYFLDINLGKTSLKLSYEQLYMPIVKWPLSDVLVVVVVSFCVDGVNSDPRFTRNWPLEALNFDPNLPCWE